MTQSPFSKVAVVGAGLMGTSTALASAACGARVAITDRDPEVRALVSRHHPSLVVEATVEEAVSGADVVFLAVPVAAIGAVARAASSAVLSGSILTDLGSVKSQVVLDVERMLPEGVQFVGGHPMAGSERQGASAADGKIFQGATWVLTPGDRVNADAFGRLGAHLRAMGARVLAMEPMLHDRLVAVVSHLPQILASTLAVRADATADQDGDAVLALAAGGFRDVTRIAGSDPALWRGILETNRLAVLDALGAFESELDAFRRALESEDWDAVVALLERGRRARERLPEKERAGVLADVVVPVEDRPGSLAMIMTALGESGINIEDLRMRHATDLEAGALIISVDQGSAARAMEILRLRGALVERHD